MSRTSNPGPPASAMAAPEAGRALLGPLIETTKPGITRMVVITSVVGLLIASIVHWPVPAGVLVLRLALCAAGTWLCAGGANSLNEWMERDRDALMHRTRSRPLPRGALQPAQVLLFGLACTVVGSLALLAIGPIPALLALACTFSYLAVYTPMKSRTPLSTLVGAIPGALPPMIGWSAIAGPWDPYAIVEPGGLSLFILMFVWQLPHFLAIAWMYRDDYARGGYRVLPVIDPSGRATSATMLATSLMLIAATLFPAFALREHVSLVYVFLAATSGWMYVLLALRLVRQRTRDAARRVFFASIMHLPLLLTALVIDALL